MLRLPARVLRALSVSFFLTTVALPLHAQPTTVPSPEQFFGYRMGADRKLANWDRLLEYYRTVAKSSDRVKLVELGTTSERRPYIALFISSPANLARLDELRQLNAMLADPRGATPADIARATSTGRAVILQTFGLQ